MEPLFRFCVIASFALVSSLANESLAQQQNVFPQRGPAGIGITNPKSINPAVFSRFIVVRGDPNDNPAAVEPGTPAIILSETSNKFGDGESNWSIGVCSDGHICIWDDRNLRLDIGDAGVTANALILTGADLAEPFQMAAADAAEPGMVVSIDPAQPGRMRLSGTAYDRTVAGVVSGANGLRPGVTMGQDGSRLAGALPVALTGRVYVLANAANGAIEPGDLLTTSDVPGQAMKVTDRTRAQGAIIGKAMGPLAEGQGLILALVSLQ